MNASVERVREALTELIKAALISDDSLSFTCREAGRTKLAALAGDPPDPASLRMDGAWTLAIHDAEAPDLAPLEGQVNLTLPRACPLPWRRSSHPASTSIERSITSGRSPPPADRGC